MVRLHGNVNSVSMIHPLVLGTGHRLFPEGGHASLRLTGSVITTKGVLMATYGLDRDWTAATCFHPDSGVREVDAASVDHRLIR
jgi:hypothetical protein